MDSERVWLAFGSAMALVVEHPVIEVGLERAFDSVLGFDCGVIGNTDGDGVSLIRMRGVGGDVVFLFEWDLDWRGRRFFGIAFVDEALMRVLVAPCRLTFVDPELMMEFDGSPASISKII